ncbi:MAG: amidase [Ruminococcaceae bacterium]|nr:amidase [Oscillospiraceae bacterium]
MPEIKAYNREKAVQYARKWAYDRNPAYYDFSAIGGDCTNYISQCLYAGSGVMNFAPETGWYYRSVNDRSPSWTGVEFLYNFLISNRTRGPFAEETDNMRLGDVIQLGNEERFYHSLLVTGIRDGQIYVAAHTFNAYMRPLASYTFEKIRYLHIAGVYV